MQHPRSFRHLERPLFSVQYHPEASPGPHDSAYLFDAFIRMMRSRKPLESKDFRVERPGTASVGELAGQ